MERCVNSRQQKKRMKNVALGGQKREGRNSKNLSDYTLNQGKDSEKDN